MAARPNAILQGNQMKMAGSLPQFAVGGAADSMFNHNGGQMATVGSMPGGQGNTMSKLEAMKPWFGSPQRQQEEQAYSWWDSENYDLPDGLKGRCAYMLNILITNILTSEMWPVTEMLPYKKNDAGLTIQWDEWRFNDSLLDRTPEETTSRMLTNNSNSFSAHMVRRGKAFILEHGFWMTPKGQKNWAMNVIQIVNATNETACFGASHEVLTCVAFVDPNDRYRNQHDRTSQDIDRIVKENTDNFARVNKEEGGYDTCIAKLDEVFSSRNGHKANYLILPSGCEQFVRNRPENNYHFLNGVGRTNRDITKEGGRTVRMSRGYRLGEHQPNCDPHYTVVCIGGFHVFNDEASMAYSAADSLSIHRDLKIFSMKTDDIVPMRLQHYLQYTGIYENAETDHPKMSWIGAAFFARYKCKTWGDLLRAADAESRAVEKINSLSDADYTEFLERFSEDDNGKGTPLPVHQIDVNQPTTAGQRVDAHLDAFGQLTKALDAEHSDVRSFLRDVASHMTSKNTGTFRFKFQGSTAATRVGIASKKRDHHFSRDVYFATNEPLYHAAAKMFVLFYIDGTAASFPLRAVGSLGDSIDSTEAMNDCARVEFSIAASYLYALAAIFAERATDKDAETLLDSTIAQYRAWLQGTHEHSLIFGGEGSLASMFSHAAFKRRIEFQVIRQVDGQKSVDFSSLFDVIKVLSTAQSTPKDRSAFLHAVQVVLSESEMQPKAAGTVAIRWDEKRHNAAELKKLKSEIDAKLLEPTKLKTAEEKENYLLGFNIRWLTMLDQMDVYLAWVGQNLPGFSDFNRTDVVVIATVAARQRDAFATHELLQGVIDVIDDIDPDSGLESAFTTANLRDYTPGKNAFKEINEAAVNYVTAMQVLRDENIKAVTIVNDHRLNKVTAATEAVAALGDQRMWNSEIVEFVKGGTTNEESAKRTNANEAFSSIKDAKDGMLAIFDLADYLRVVDNVKTKAKTIKLAKEMFETKKDWNPYMNTLNSKLTVPAHIVVLYAILSGKPFSEQLFRETTSLTRAYFNNDIMKDVKEDELWEYFITEENGVIEEVPKMDESGSSSSSSPPPPASSATVKLPVSELKSLLSAIPLTSGKWLKYTFEKNIPNPLGAIGFRLHKQYEMGTAVMMDAFGQAGYTYFGYADFQLGDDIGKKVHVAHFTLYLKSLVQQNKLIVYARYIVCRNYFGGEGTVPWNPLDQQDVSDFKLGKITKDIIYAPILSDWKTNGVVCMDITGRFPASLQASQSSLAADMHYPTADIVCKIWGIRHSQNKKLHCITPVSSLQPNFQTIALQEHTQTWNKKTEDFTTIIKDQGHWGDSVYPGCGKVRRGEGRCLERPSWIGTQTISIRA